MDHSHCQLAADRTEETDGRTDGRTFFTVNSGEKDDCLLAPACLAMTTCCTVDLWISDLAELLACSALAGCYLRRLLATWRIFFFFQSFRQSLICRRRC